MALNMIEVPLPKDEWVSVDVGDTMVSIVAIVSASDSSKTAVKGTVMWRFGDDSEGIPYNPAGGAIFAEQTIKLKALYDNLVAVVVKDV